MQVFYVYFGDVCAQLWLKYHRMVLDCRKIISDKKYSLRLVGEAEVGRTDLKERIVGKGNRSGLYDVRQQQMHE